MFLTESMSICEYLEEKFPEHRRLLPVEPYKKFQVRRICEMINAGMQPIANLAVLNKVAEISNADEK